MTEFRVFRTFKWEPIRDRVFGGKVIYELIHTDTIQHKNIGDTDWTDIPVVLAEKPKHPDTIKLEQEQAKVSLHLNKVSLHLKRMFNNPDLEKYNVTNKFKDVK